jgi:hypothetical protein
MTFRLVLLGGFLGAGKTTTMLAAARLLESRGRRVAVITNDQGDRLVDTDAARAANVAVAEVAGGCFCCRFEDLAGAIERVVERGGADTVIAEAVGSCADLQATVVRPLRRSKVHVAPLTVVVEPDRLEHLPEDTDLAYLLGRQLEEADVIALNKCDTRAAGTLRLTARLLADGFPAAAIVPYSAHEDVSELVAAWERPSPRERELEIEYDRYAAAEAQLGWLNTEIEVGLDLDPGVWATALLNEISERSERRGYVVGHVKLSLGGLSGNLVAAGGRPHVRGVAGAAGRARVNARVACPPAELDDLVRRAASAADGASGARSRFAGTAAFAPSYPRPVHRLEAAR